MEVATTNNHSQSHHHRHHNHLLQPHQQGGGNGGNGSRSPFQREVREWQRIDPDTGALFSGRLEADRWINGPLNSYGKISDSQNISQPNGTQHTQRKQFEVLQARTANGAMQVIRTQTVQKTSSTSRWSSTSTTTTSRAEPSAPWLAVPAPSHSVDICEVDDANDNVSIASSNSSKSSGSSRSDREAGFFVAEPRNGHSQSQELVDDHVDFVVINEQADIDEDDDDVGHLHQLGHNLLPDTAPSLKLSNLMKSSSSISSQSSNNSNLTTATAAATATTNNNTHRSAGKISLHAIVGQAAGKGKTATATATTTTTTTTSKSAAAATTAASSTSTASTTSWHQQRLTEQPDIYGNSNSSKLKMLRVGVGGGSGSGGAGGGVGLADVPTAAAAATPTLRRDLESFRHYNVNDGNENSNSNVAVADADNDLRLTARHQRRQQVSQSVYAPPVPVLCAVPLQRSRSISTDDLSNDWQQQQSDEEPAEWRRVSKLRRSFQSQDYHTKTAAIPPRRPLDLPSNSVSVARMRAELENGRRLNTAMRNNHVDLAALDNILNTPELTIASTKPAVAKRSTFLTAESLQEIRGKLKRLSDENLYKEDFLAYQARRQTTPPQTVEEQPVVSAFRPVRGQHNTHSLESRQRQKDTSSSEWHLRRKSYGFEKMSPPEDKSIFRVDASTDSGLGRSGEQLGNWSPTERSGAGGTIIHFGAGRKPAPPSPTEAELSKRHSIAVEETWRDLRKTSQVHVNGVNEASTSSSLTASHMQQRSSAQKRVEFCKTEVHFAAESGRVNIVETDGKPPPTQNFRRRRRTASGPLQSLVKSASTVSSSNSSTSSSSISNVTHFGDDAQRRKTIASSTVAYRATVMEPPELVTQPTGGGQVTVTTTAKPAETRYSLLEATSRSSYTSTSGVDTTDNETDELAHIRGILKNKPIKPKPYHLGENIERADVLWSVPTKTERESPLGREIGPTDDAATLASKSVAERVRLVEQRNFDATTSQPQQQQPQQLSPAGNGYSTKINVSLGNESWSDTDLQKRQQRRPSAQELLLQDLRAHQRILDEGLKSTSLIMKTMRSASEFDEAMRRLSIASIESALLQPTIVVPTPMLRSHSYQEESTSLCSSRRTSTTSITSSDLFGSTLYDSLPRSPLAPPRLKLLGNTQIPVSQQLTQLRRLYDAAAEEEADSADEEVKRYFHDNNNNNSDSGGGTQDSSSLEDVRTGCEYSSSWSRLKAKRTIWKIEAHEQTLKRTDVPNTNVMSIALHAPRLEKPHATPPTLRIGQLVPVAKPRTLLIQPQPQLQAQSMTADDESGSESLKIVKEARGARKLREHELSYFGVQAQTPTKFNTSTTTTNPRRTLPTRSRHTHSEAAAEQPAAATTTTTKWQLLNDRPDLLRHSPHGSEKRQQATQAPNVADLDEHCYENIANELTTTFRVKSPSPISYERKADLQRDAQILSEMTRNADQTMKALSDEAALKDQRRRSTSLQRRSAKPLETIDEKVYNAERQAPSVTRGTYASEARRNSRHSTPSPTRARSSSQSSIEIECCPRARSRSLSSEREFVASKTRNRSSSRESNTHAAGGNSSDEQAAKQRAERLRMRTPKREKSRHAPDEADKHRHSSKQRSSSNVEPKRVHHSSHNGIRSSRHRTDAEAGSSSKHSSGVRLVRSTRVSEETRPRMSTQRAGERSRASEKHREELTRSRGHSSRSRHSEQPTRDAKTTKSGSHSHGQSSTSSSMAHKKSSTSSHTTSKSPSAAASTTKATHKANHHSSSNSNTHTTTTQAHSNNELTHGKNAQPQMNGHHQQHHHDTNKHHTHGQQQHQQHHVHSLTTTTIAASKQQRDRHGKDRK